MASVSWRLASMSLRSMRLASETSSSAVSSETLPISLKYMRTESLVVVLIERSSLGMTSSSGLFSTTSSTQSDLALDDVDAQVGEQVVDVVDLVGGQIDVLQGVGDVVGGEIALLATLLEQRADLFVRARPARMSAAVFRGIDHSGFRPSSDVARMKLVTDCRVSLRSSGRLEGTSVPSPRPAAEVCAWRARLD